jgi:phospholipase C
VPAVQFLDNFIQQIQASSAWNSVAIVITFDTGGGWYDHVAPPAVDAQGLGFRVPMLVISPLAKRGYISHVQMDHVSILRFIQWNWGLASLNSRNSASVDIRDMFAF